jgi:hypothetical protein
VTFADHDAEPDFDAHSEVLEKAAHDFDLDMAQEYLENEVRQAFKGRSAESTRAYLGTYGDAVTERVERAIADARDLLASGHTGPAITLAATAVELIVGYLVVRPIVQGAFLSDQWAGVLTDQILGGRTDQSRRLLPIIATAWGLDLDKAVLPSGKPVWGSFTGSVIPARNNFVHRADSVSPEIVTQAIGCAVVLLGALVVAVGRSVDMNWPAHPWHQAYVVGGTIQRFKPRDPFAKGST